ncbi:MAG: Spy/CpxP family protein refolding chaperone [Desulfobaccales bacterium]
MGVALLASNPVQALEPGGPNDKLVKELNLSPEKTKEFQAVGEKYIRSRKEIVERIKKGETELERALAAPKPDEGRIKDLAVAISGDHGQLFETFKAQRQEELQLLSPLQQGKFILALKRWHEEMCKK